MYVALSFSYTLSLVRTNDECILLTSSGLHSVLYSFFFSESRDVEAMEEALAREHRDEQFQSELAHASARSTEELLLVRETSQRELVEIATQLREMTEEKERIVLEKEASLVAHQTVVTEHESQVRAAAARGAEEAQKLRFEQETLAASLNEVQVALEKAESEVQRSAASRSEEEISTIAIRAELFESEEKRTLEGECCASSSFSSYKPMYEYSYLCI